MKDLAEIGKYIEATRKEKHLTLEEVHKRTLIHMRVLRSIEDGTCDTILSNVYLKGFIRKYSDFLGVDSNELLSGFEGPSEQKIHLDAENQSKTGINIEQYMPLVVGVVSIILIVAFISLGISGLKKFFSKPSPPVPQKTTEKISRKKELKKQEVKKVTEKKRIKKKYIAGSAKKSRAVIPISKVRVSLKSTDNVWLRVERDGIVVFKGVLKDGSEESWVAEKQLKIRAGKLEELKFTINKKYIGKLGYGVKNITIDRNGIRIGKKKYKPKS